MISTTLTTILSFATAAAASPIFISTAMSPQATGGVETCNGIPFHPSAFSCFNGNILCPIANRLEGRQQLMPCGSDPNTSHCFSPDEFECKDGKLFPVMIVNGTAATGSGFAAPAGDFMAMGTEPSAVTDSNFALETMAVETYPPKYTVRDVPTTLPHLMYD